MAYLVVTANGKEIYRRELAGPVTLGRSTDCELWLNDAGVSRRHCKFERVGDAWEVHDLGSRNGVLMHGERVEKQVLRDGDVVRIGGSRITFHEVGFVSARPSAPTRSQDPMAETTVTRAEFNGVRPLPNTPKPAPGKDAGEPAKDTAPSPVVPLAFTRPIARPIPVAQNGEVEDHADGERSQGIVRRWLQKK